MFLAHTDNSFSSIFYSIFLEKNVNVLDCVLGEGKKTNGKDSSHGACK
jgi:hypothetical protein